MKNNPLPEGWKEVRLGNIGFIYSGGTPSRQISKYWNGEIPWISSSNLIEEDIFYIGVKEYISEEGLKNSSTKLIPRGSIIVVSRVGVGKVAINNEDLCTSQDFQSIVIDNDGEVLNIWLAYYLQVYLKVLMQKNQGTSIKGFQKKELTESILKVPPLEEQERIVKVLEVWDKAISTTTALLEKKRHLLLSLYGYFFVPSKVNEGWSIEKIGKYIIPRSEKMVPTLASPLYSLTIENGVTPKTDRYNRDFLVKDKGNKKYKVVYPDDIVFNPSNLRWGAIARSFNNKKVLLSPIYEICEVKKSEIDIDFFTHLLCCPRQIKIFATKVEGTLQERMAVKLETFLLQKIKVPSLAEQNRIANILNKVQEEIDLLEKLLEQYKQQKKGLLEKLLTAQWRT